METGNEFLSEGALWLKACAVFGLEAGLRDLPLDKIHWQQSNFVLSLLHFLPSIVAFVKLHASPELLSIIWQ